MNCTGFVKLLFEIIRERKNKRTNFKNDNISILKQLLSRRAKLIVMNYPVLQTMLSICSFS